MYHFHYTHYLGKCKGQELSENNEKVDEILKRRKEKEKESPDPYSRVKTK